MINLAEGNDAVERASELQNQGFSDAQVYEALKKDGYTSVQIDDAINQAKLGNPPQEANLDEVEALIESIIEEKWKNSLQRFGNMDVWRERVKTDVTSVKQELIRLEHRFDNIEKAILGKISQYDKNIVNIGNEMKVLEQVFQKIITPLTTNIKELSRITKEMKEK